RRRPGESRSLENRRGAASMRGALSAVLVRFGVDPKRYWLLMDLFHAISDRGEMMDQLGRNGVAMGMAAILYGLLSVVMTAFSLLAHQRVSAHLAGFLF